MLRSPLHYKDLPEDVSLPPILPLLAMTRREDLEDRPEPREEPKAAAVDRTGMEADGEVE